MHVGYHQTQKAPLLKPTTWRCHPWPWTPKVRKAFRNERELANHLSDEKARQKSARMSRLSVASKEWESRHLPSPPSHAAGHCGTFSHLMSRDGAHQSVWPSIFFQGFLQNGNLRGLSYSLILIRVEWWKVRRLWFSKRGEGAQKERKKRTGGPSLVRNNAVQSGLCGSSRTGSMVRKAGHAGVFPAGNNHQQHCFLIRGIMNNTVDPIYSFSQRRTFPCAVSPSDLLIL